MTNHLIRAQGDRHDRGGRWFNPIDSNSARRRPGRVDVSVAFSMPECGARTSQCQHGVNDDRPAGYQWCRRRLVRTVGRVEQFNSFFLMPPTEFLVTRGAWDRRINTALNDSTWMTDRLPFLVVNSMGFPLLRSEGKGREGGRPRFFPETESRATSAPALAKFRGADRDAISAAVSVS